MAKNREAAVSLARAVAGHEVEKYYLAVSDRKPKKKQGEINGDMEKGRRGSWKLSRLLTNPAITEFKSCFLAPGLRLFLLHPHAGRTHELRVALKSIEAPILGDLRYHPLTVGGQEPDRAYLHCYALGFELNGKSHRYRRSPTTGLHFYSVPAGGSRFPGSMGSSVAVNCGFSTIYVYAAL